MEPWKGTSKPATTGNKPAMTASKPSTSSAKPAGRLVLPALVDGQEADDQEVRRAVSACYQRAGAALVAPARTFGRSRTGRSLRDSARARLERGATSCQYLIPCRSCEGRIRAREPHRPDGSGPLASENSIQTVTVVVRRPREGV